MSDDPEGGSSLLAPHEPDPAVEPAELGTRPPRQLRPGQLTLPWAVILAVGWGLIITGLVAVGIAGARLGKPAWWLGTDEDPRPFPIWLAPVVAPGLALLAAAFDIRRVLWVSLGAALVTLGIALGDRTSSPGVALAEALLGVAGLLLTLAGVAGRVRRAP